MGLRPTNAEEVREALAARRGTGACLSVVGGGTLLGAGDPPDRPCERLETTAMSATVVHEPADLTCTIEPGVTLGDLEERLAAHRQTLPVFHPAPDRATLGGLVAFGWTGLGTQLHGLLRDRVLEVRVVTGEAKIVRGGGKVVKNVTGFDLPRLFCGSLGTLGVIVELTLKVHPAPRGLHGRVRRGSDPGELADALRRAVETAPMPIEAVLAGGGQEWEAYVFAPGPAPDAEILLGGLEGAEPADGEAFERLAADPVLCPSVAAWGPHEVVCRATLRPAAVPGYLALIAPTRRAVVDVAAGRAWFVHPDPERLDRLPEEELAMLDVLGFVMLHAPEDVRRSWGRLAREPGGGEVMARLKQLFDPDGVLASRRMSK